MDPIDHTQTMVLIIGVSDYPEDDSIPSIPNIMANVQLLKSSLVNKEVIGIPESNITVSINENKSQIEKKLKNIAEKTSNKSYTLVIYYTGHGIYSPVDFQLYFTTHQTTRRDLEIDGLNIDVFKNHIRRSRAARKVVILDCCHSGAFIGAMGDVVSQIQSNVNGFEGTYVMTSAAEDEPSLYPVKSPDRPTYFTGKLIEIVNQGLDNDCRYCSLRDLYNQIETDFRNEGLPVPQQSNFNKADQLLFWKNRLYHEKKPEDEVAWEETLLKNSKWAYLDFRKMFPSSRFDKLAKQKIKELEEEEYWQNAVSLSTVSSFTDYLDIFPEGKYADEANRKLNELRYQHELQEEKRYWRKVTQLNEPGAYKDYLKKYPNGKYADACKKEIDNLQNMNSRLQETEAAGKRVLEEARRESEQQEEQKRKKDEQLASQRKKQEAKAEQNRLAENKAATVREHQIKEEKAAGHTGLIIEETPFSNERPVFNARKIAMITGLVLGAILLIKVLLVIIGTLIR